MGNFRMLSFFTSIILLFEISRTLYDNMKFINVKNDDSQVARSVSNFVHLVDYGAEMEHHLAFLVDCRATFGRFNELKETLVHSSNSLANQSLQCAKKDLSFLKSCVTFSEVTIPYISSQRQFDLFLETAEVTFLGGLVSHVDGLIDSGISCLHILDKDDGLRTPDDIEGLVSSIRKLCGFLIMVPVLENEYELFHHSQYAKFHVDSSAVKLEFCYMNFEVDINVNGGSTSLKYPSGTPRE
ncbi:hypothetical protein RYX36_033113 [Vicia faba]